MTIPPLVCRAGRFLQRLPTRPMRGRKRHFEYSNSLKVLFVKQISKLPSDEMISRGTITESSRLRVVRSTSLVSFATAAEAGVEADIYPCRQKFEEMRRKKSANWHLLMSAIGLVSAKFLEYSLSSKDSDLPPSSLVIASVGRSVDQFGHDAAIRCG